MRCCVPIRIVACGCILICLAGSWAVASEASQAFFLNGKPIEPAHWSLSGEASTIMPGDVICFNAGAGLGEVFVTVSQEGVVRFVNPEAEDGEASSQATDADAIRRRGCLFLELPDGRLHLVAVRVGATAVRREADPEPQDGTEASVPAARARPSYDMVLSNPLAEMSPEEIHGLWGISVDAWPEDMAERLSHVDAERVCLAVDDTAGLEGRSLLFGGPVFPPIPPETRYLVVTDSRSPGLQDFSNLSHLEDLVFLRFEGSSHEPLEAGLISQNASMRCLDISSARVDSYEKLAALSELRYLDVSRSSSIDDLSFIAGMRQLGTLILGGTRVVSLSPLDNSASIRQIHASMTLVRVLPRGELPALRTLDLVATNIDASTVSRFRESHPQCLVRYGWTEMLREAVAETTRLRVRSGGTGGPSIEEERTLVEITDRGEIERLVAQITIDERRSGGYCACHGEPTFEFYAGERLLAVVGYHHGERLRWAGGYWPGDGELTGVSRAFLISWLAQHGVDGPRQEVDARQRRQAESIRQQQRYAELIPPETLAAVLTAQRSEQASILDDSSGQTRFRVMAEAFIAHEQDPQASLELYFKLFGVIPDEPWNTYGSYYDSVVADHLLGRFAGAPLAQAALAVAGDEEGRAGAMRWFFGEQGWRNLDESDRARILTPLARRALELPNYQARPRTMVALAEMGDGWALEMLRQVLSRSESEAGTLRRSESGYAVTLADGSRVWSGQCSDRLWAAICLARAGDQASLPAIEKLAAEAPEPDQELFRKAATLLRENAGDS